MEEEGPEGAGQGRERSLGRLRGPSKTDLFFAMMEASELEELRLEMSELREIIEGLRAIVMRMMAHPQGKHILWHIFKEMKIDRRTARRLLEDVLPGGGGSPKEAFDSERAT